MGEWSNDDGDHSEERSHEQRPECDSPKGGDSNNTRCSLSSSRASVSSSIVGGGSTPSVGGAPFKGGSLPKQRRMSMSIKLPEGPVRKHKYQPPPTVHSYLNKMNAEVGT